MDNPAGSLSYLLVLLDPRELKRLWRVKTGQDLFTHEICDALVRSGLASRSINQALLLNASNLLTPLKVATMKKIAAAVIVKHRGTAPAKRKPSPSTAGKSPSAPVKRAGKAASGS